jgi:hypothetical protein
MIQAQGIGRVQGTVSAEELRNRVVTASTKPASGIISDIKDTKIATIYDEVMSKYKC